VVPTVVRMVVLEVARVRRMAVRRRVALTAVPMVEPVEVLEVGDYGAGSRCAA
jgi:hypothetical protein